MDAITLRMNRNPMTKGAQYVIIGAYTLLLRPDDGRAIHAIEAMMNRIQKSRPFPVNSFIEPG
jgi:hypothetical protein